MSRKPQSHQTSPTTGGWLKRCRLRGLRSRQRLSRRMIRLKGASSASTTCALALDAAVRGGNDTDTVAAIAGGLLGAAYGASAVPADWRRVLHGWPDLRTHD